MLEQKSQYPQRSRVILDRSEHSAVTIYAINRSWSVSMFEQPFGKLVIVIRDRARQSITTSLGLMGVEVPAMVKQDLEDVRRCSRADLAGEFVVERW
jgi:ABC-type uncharacterized transport system YnjBCD ATPase subunit